MFVSTLSIFPAPLDLHGRFFGWLGWQHCLNRAGGWVVGGGGESRPENIRQLEQRRLLFYSILQTDTALSVVISEIFLGNFRI
jgi:hypothetical protein